MKLAWRLFSLAAACLLLAAVAAAQTKEVTAAEKEVWQLEEDYWKYAQAFDLESYRTLWHEEFVGWPRSEAVPVGKSGITGWLERRKNTGHALRYKLERRAVREIEGAVVAHYTVHVEWAAKDGKAESEVSRITHTWVKSGGRWKIITGMSAPIEKPVAK
jgi:ketosteroid isomerase-like protein